MTLLQIETMSGVENLIQMLLKQGTLLGFSILKAIVIYAVGHFVIKLINKLVRKVLEKRGVAPAVKSFVSSLVYVVLIVLLIISVIGALGVQTTSFAALLASAGIAIGMALSGNLSNFAGGLIILLFKPFRIGDYISTSTVDGTVAEIQIFHTILNTGNNIKVFVPNGVLSSGFINNFNIDKRRMELTIGVDYGTDFEYARSVILETLSQESRILRDPEPFIELDQLNANSVNILIRYWAKTADFWDVNYLINKNIYKAFNEKGIRFSHPQLVVHQRKDT